MGKFFFFVIIDENGRTSKPRIVYSQSAELPKSGKSICRGESPTRAQRDTSGAARGSGYIHTGDPAAAHGVVCSFFILSKSGSYSRRSLLLATHRRDERKYRHLVGTRNATIRCLDLFETRVRHGESRCASRARGAHRSRKHLWNIFERICSGRGTSSRSRASVPRQTRAPPSETLLAKSKTARGY